MALEFYLATEDGVDITTEDGRRLFLFSFASEHATQHAIDVDWDDDGSFSGDNEADYMTRFSINRGRERLIGGPGRGFEPYKIGRVIVTLENESGRYNPWNTGGELYGLLGAGKTMRWRGAVYNPAVGSKHDTFDIFTGYVDDLQPTGWNKTATLICEDGFGLLDGAPVAGGLIRMPYIIMSGENNRVKLSIEEIIEASEYPYDSTVSGEDAEPNAQYMYPLLWWSEGRGALKDLQNVCDITLGSLAVLGNGELVYTSIFDTDPSILTITDDLVSKNPHFPNPWEYSRDIVEFNGYDLKEFYVPFVTYLSTDETPIFLPGPSSADDPVQLSKITLWYDNVYKDDDSNTPYLMPEVEIDELNLTVLANTEPDGSGSSTFSNLIISGFRFLRRTRITIENTGVDCYIRQLGLQSLGPDGVLIWTYTDNEWQYGATGGGRDNRKFVIDRNPFINRYIWKDPFMSGFSYATAQRNEAYIDLVGGLMLNYLTADITPTIIHPILEMRGRPSEQWLLDLEKRVRYHSKTLNEDLEFRVCGIKHRTLGSTQDVLTTIYLYPVIPVGHLP